MGFFSDLKQDLSQAVNELVIADEPVDETTPAESESANTTEEKLQESKIIRDTQQEETALYVETISESPSVTRQDEASVILEGMTVMGDITTKGALDILGSVKGNINTVGRLTVIGSINGNVRASEIYANGAKIVGELSSDGTVEICPNTVLIGNIRAGKAQISGAVQGDIDVQGLVSLSETAVVMGNIKSKMIRMSEGAVVEGMCSQCYSENNPALFFKDYNKK